MSRAAALGAAHRVEGFALAGALVVAVDDGDADRVREAWASLPDDVAVVVLTPAAADALAPTHASAAGPLQVVLPS